MGYQTPPTYLPKSHWKPIRFTVVQQECTWFHDWNTESNLDPLSIQQAEPTWDWSILWGNPSTASAVLNVIVFQAVNSALYFLGVSNVKPTDEVTFSIGMIAYPDTKTTNFRYFQLASFSVRKILQVRRANIWDLWNRFYVLDVPANSMTNETRTLSVKFGIIKRN